MTHSAAPLLNVIVYKKYIFFSADTRQVMDKREKKLDTSATMRNWGRSWRCAALIRECLINVNKDESSSVVVFGFRYIGDDGKKYSVRYMADENGYREENGEAPGPIAAPLPPHVIASLAGWKIMLRIVKE